MNKVEKSSTASHVPLRPDRRRREGAAIQEPKEMAWGAGLLKAFVTGLRERVR